MKLPFPARGQTIETVQGAAPLIHLADGVVLTRHVHVCEGDAVDMTPVQRMLVVSEHQDALSIPLP